MHKKDDVSAKDIEEFLDAGFVEAQIFELLIGITAKVMTNFASKLGRVPVDDEFAGYAWSTTTNLSQRKNAA